MTSPFLYFPTGRLSRAELSAARLDGHLIEIDDAYAPADTVETAAMRARSLEPLLGATLAATHVSAAWVHGAIADPPARHTVQRAVPRRLHSVIHRRLHYRDLCLPEDARQVIGGVAVTTPVRTVLDLARVADPSHDAALAGMLEADPELAEAALRQLERAGALPHKVRAIRALAVRTR